MIVRIQGEGQYELDDAVQPELERMDAEMFKAIGSENEEGFHHALKAIVSYIEAKGKKVPDDELMPSNAILPGSDTTLEEAKRLFTDEGYLTPVEA